jgi:hypothetical protein
MTTMSITLTRRTLWDLILIRLGSAVRQGAVVLRACDTDALMTAVPEAAATSWRETTYSSAWEDVPQNCGRGA